MEGGAFEHPAAAADDGDGEGIGFTDFKSGVEGVGWGGIVILGEGDFWDGEQPDCLGAFAIIDVIGAGGGSIFEGSDELGPEEAARFLIPERFWGFLPGIDIDIDVAIGLGFEGEIGDEEGGGVEGVGGEGEESGGGEEAKEVGGERKCGEERAHG